MEGPTPVRPQRDLRIDDLPRLDSRLENDERDLLESVFIDDHLSADGTASPAWVEIPPDDISLRAARTLYPPPARRKRRFNENTLLTALAVVATIAAAIVLFFLARGPSRPVTTAARRPAAEAPAAQPPSAGAGTETSASPAQEVLPATASAPGDTAPPSLPKKPIPAAATPATPDRTPTAGTTSVVRNSPPAVNTPPAARPPVQPVPRPSRDPNAETAALLGRPATAGARPEVLRPAAAIAPSVAPAAPTPAAPVIPTPPVTTPSTATPSSVVATPSVVTAPSVVTTPPVVTQPVATAGNVAAAAAPPAAPRPAAAAATSPAAPALATEEQGVRAIVERYRAAYSALDVNAVRTIWPGVNARALGRAFDQLSTQQLDFAGCEIAVAGDRASAGCSGNTEFVPKVGNKTPRLEARTWSFVLRKSGAQWTIDAVESR